MCKEDFALLCGRAFLYELSEGRIDSAIAFGRAFLISIGEKDTASHEDGGVANGKEHREGWAVAEN